MHSPLQSKEKTNVNELSIAKLLPSARIFSIKAILQKRRGTPIYIPLSYRRLKLMYITIIGDEDKSRHQDKNIKNIEACHNL